jgi:ECL1/2/3 zinc binding proteins
MREANHASLRFYPLLLWSVSVAARSSLPELTGLSCRREDDTKSLSASGLPSTHISQSAPVTPRSTSPPRSAASSPVNTPPVVRIPTELHGHKSDLDPTEWKPKLTHRNNSEAYQYLSKFHASMAGSENIVRAERPRYGRHKSTMSVTASTTPSLGNTPTTVASSFDSVYEFNTRPLLPRHNPMYALSSGAKSDELVKPHIAPPISIAVSSPEETDKIDWSKKVVIKDTGSQKDGLSALLNRK